MKFGKQNEGLSAEVRELESVQGKSTQACRVAFECWLLSGKKKELLVPC